MRPQRPASASPYNAVTTTTTTAGGKRANTNTSTGGNNSGEIQFLQEQLSSVAHRQADLDASHQREVVAYRHRLRRLYNDNASLRNIITAAEARRRDGDRLVARGAGASSGGGGVEAATVTEAECASMQQRIDLSARKTNQLRHTIAQEENLSRQAGLAGTAARAVLGTTVQSEVMAGGCGSTFLKIQTLERKLDAVLLQESALHMVLRGYEHHTSALAAEVRRYESRAGHLETELAARHRDQLRMTTLYQNALEDSRHVADDHAALVRTLARLRVAKEKALADKTAEVNAALRDTQRRERRLTDLRQQLDEEAQQLEYAEHQRSQVEQRRRVSRPVMEIVQGRSTTSPASAEHDEAEDGNRPHGSMLCAADQERLTAYEHAFRAMVQSARVERLEELVAAYEAERAGHDGLAAQVAEARERHTRLSAEVRQMRRRAETLSGTTTATATSIATATVPSRMLVAELRAFVREAEADVRARIADNEAGQSLLLDVARRADAIASKLAWYRPDVAIAPTAEVTLICGGGGVSDDHHATTAATAASGRTSLIGELTVLKHKLLALADDAMRAAAAESCGGNDHRPTNTNTGIIATVRSAQVVIPENNLRVNTATAATATGGGRDWDGVAAAHCGNSNNDAAAATDAMSAHGIPATAAGGGGSFCNTNRGGQQHQQRRLSLFENYGGGADGEDDGWGTERHPGGLLADDVSSCAASSDGLDALSDGGRDNNDISSRNGTATATGGGGGGGGGGNDDAPAGGGGGVAPVVEVAARRRPHDSDDPLGREEVKKMSEAIQLRAKRRMDRARLSTAAH